MNKLLWILFFIAIGCNEEAKKNVDQKMTSSVVKVEAKDFVFLIKYPVTTLVRKTPAEIGCLLQSEFNYKDSVFNCDNKNYVNKGDPCKATKEYYEGIKIPDDLAKKIDPSFKRIELYFEHGSLQHLIITFTDSMLITKIKETFSLPSKENFPENIIDIDYGENTFSTDKPKDINYTRWVSITGFDHIGAGEAGCK